MTRAAAIAELARRVCAIELGRSVRVAIDGVDAAGKTTLADELVAPIGHFRRPVRRVSVDDFLNPAEIRYRRGRESPEGFYRDSFDHRAIIAAVSADGAAGGIVLADGIFLLRPELRGQWDFSIFVRASFAVTVARAVARDGARLGGSEAAETLYARRYVAGQQLYFADAQPEQHASVIVDNDDLERPVIVEARR